MTITHLAFFLLASAVVSTQASAKTERGLLGFAGGVPPIDCTLSGQKRTIRIFINKGTLLGVSRDVKAVDDELDTNPTPIKQANISGASYKTILDVATGDIPSIDLNSENDWAYVIVRLSRDLRFNESAPIRVPDAATSALCKLDATKSEVVVNTQNRRQFVKFAIKRKSTWGVYPYNIGIVVDSEDDDVDIKTPIYIDPKIKDNG